MAAAATGGARGLQPVSDGAAAMGEGAFGLWCLLRGRAEEAMGAGLQAHARRSLVGAAAKGDAPALTALLHSHLDLAKIEVCCPAPWAGTRENDSQLPMGEVTYYY